MGTLANWIALAIGADVATKSLLRKYQGNDFIPKGDPVQRDSLDFRATGIFELFQCCHPTGSDIQSGPYYCGEIAELVVGNRREYVGLCEKHANNCQPILRWATPDSKDNLYGSR